MMLVNAHGHSDSEEVNEYDMILTMISASHINTFKIFHF